MLDRLSEGIERELRFVSDASHELRTPLAVLRSELEVALCIDGSRAEYRAATISAAEEAERVIALAQNLLVLARAQDGRLSLELEPVPASEIFAGVAQRAPPAAGTTLSVREDAGAVDVFGDCAWLEQALLNLVHNAQRHGGGVIVLEAVPVGAAVELHVRDDGPRFPAAFLPLAFERFSRADPARARGGAGLGLAIVAGIAGAHGGEAHAQNRAGGGADVWITVPGAASRATATGA